MKSSGPISRAGEATGIFHESMILFSSIKREQSWLFIPEAVGVPRGRARRNHLKRSVDEDGRVYFSIRVSGKEYRYYEDDLIFPSDVWTDILAPAAEGPGAHRIRDAEAYGASGAPNPRADLAGRDGM